MCYVYEIESRAKDARKVFEQPQAARRLANATPKWRRQTKTFYCPDFDVNYILNGFMRA